MTIVVLVAHAVLLGVVLGPLHFVPPQTARPFVTRSIAPAPPPITPSAQPAQPAAAAVAHRPTVAPPATRQAQASAGLSRPAAARLAPAAATESSAVVETRPQALASATPSHDSGAQVATFAVPRSAHLHYKVMAQVKGMELTGEGDLLWHNDGHDYEAKLEVRAPFVRTRTQTSTGQVTAQGLEPLRFSDKNRSEQAAHFQRDKGVVSFSGNRPDAPLLAGAQDRLSVMLQLGAMIGGAPRKFPPHTEIAVQTADTQEAQGWTFTVEGMEQLHLPGGSVAALKLIRNPRKEYDQKVELWLAPGMDYVPVRLRLTQPNGDSVDQQWSSTDKG
ncbi:MAG: DUF3108 domain-containing protein [Ramlibacter sp.]